MPRMRKSQHGTTTGRSTFGIARPLTLAAVVLGVGGLAASLVPGCSSGAAVVRSGDFEVRQDAWTELGYRWDWKTPVTTVPGSRILHVVASPRYLIVVDDLGSASVHDAATGGQVWQRRLRSQKSEFLEPMFEDDSIVILTPSQLFQVSAATGRDISVINRLRRIAQTAPLYEGAFAFFGTATGLVSMQNLGLAYEHRAVQLEGPINVRPILVAEGIVGAASMGGDILFINATTGDRIVSPDMKIFGGVTASLATDGAFMFVASLDQSVYAFDPISGQRVWRHPTPTRLTSDPAVAGDAVVLTLPERGFTALNRLNGEVLWSNDSVTGTLLTTRAGELVIRSDDELVILDPARGDVIGRIPTPNAAKVLTDSAENGTIYILSPDEFIFRFEPTL